MIPLFGLFLGWILDKNVLIDTPGTYDFGADKKERPHLKIHRKSGHKSILLIVNTENDLLFMPGPELGFSTNRRWTAIFIRDSLDTVITG